MGKTFSDCVCMNIDHLGAAALRGDQAYVDQYLDALFAFNERVCGRSGLDQRPTNSLPVEQKSLLDLVA